MQQPKEDKLNSVTNVFKDNWCQDTGENLRDGLKGLKYHFVFQGSAADICKAAMIQVVSTISDDTSIHAR